MNNPAEIKHNDRYPIALNELVQLICNTRNEAFNDRELIPMDACDTDQKSWHFFNGKVCAMNDLESRLRLFINSRPEPATEPEAPSEPDSPVEQVEPGLLVVKFSNGSHLTLEEGENELALYDGMPGEGAWMGTITRDGILCSPNSGSSCADLVMELKEHL